MSKTIRMLSPSQVIFLREKIMALEQALFFNMSDAVLKLPTSVVNAFHVDEAGQVWFQIRRPIQNLNEFDKNLPARLDFYKKGENFYLHITGNACIVADPEEINSVSCISEEIKQQGNKDMVLVKLKTTDIHYFPLTEITPSAQSSAFIKALQNIVKDIIPVFQTHRNSDKARSDIHFRSFLFR